MIGELKASGDPKIVIVGAGFAGAATAWWLRHLGETDVLVIDRGAAAGLESSGQNAAMARQATADPFTTRLLAEGVRFMSAPPGDFYSRRPVLLRAGSALIGSQSQIQKMSQSLQYVLPSDQFEISSVDRLANLPYLKGIKGETALLTKSDGFVDLESLLNGYLAGTRIQLMCELHDAKRISGEWRLETSQGPIRCQTLVIAAGSRAGAIGEKSGSAFLPLNPTRRHLFQSAVSKDFFGDAPFVWDTATECYVRPDLQGGLFLSACDQEQFNASSAPKVDVTQVAFLRAKISRSFPALSRVKLHRFWCGARTLTPDGRFIVGPDPKMDQLFWVAGLGGHGVTASATVGRIAAESILGVKPPPKEVSPGRF